MMKFLFINPKCPTPYDSDTLRTRGLGGTEGAVIHVAQELSTLHTVTVWQHNRTIALHESPSHVFLPMSSLEQEVVRLGSMPQHFILQHLRKALSVFYMQRKRAETFELVSAQANAVGTPVLAHRRR